MEKLNISYPETTISDPARRVTQGWIQVAVWPDGYWLKDLETAGLLDLVDSFGSEHQKVSVPDLADDQIRSYLIEQGYFNQ